MCLLDPRRPYVSGQCSYRYKAELGESIGCLENVLRTETFSDVLIVGDTDFLCSPANDMQLLSSYHRFNSRLHMLTPHWDICPVQITFSVVQSIINFICEMFLMSHIPLCGYLNIS